MAGKDDDKNKSGTGGESGQRSDDGRMSTDEIAAAAAAAKKILDDEKGGDGGDKGKGGGDDDLLNTDPNKDRKDGNIDIEKTLSYVDKLKDENARRRIEGRKLNERLTKTEQQLQDAAKALEDATARMKEFDDKDKQTKDKEKNDLERAISQIEDLTTTVNALKTELDDAKASEQAANQEMKVTNREVMIERLVDSQGVKFASEFEREGLIAKLTKRNAEGDFDLNKDEVVYQVMKFIETAPKAGDDDTGGGGARVPGAGPGGRKTQTPVADEIESLLAKKGRMDEKETSRLRELLSMSSEANKQMTATPRMRRI